MRSKYTTHRFFKGHIQQILIFIFAGAMQQAAGSRGTMRWKKIKKSIEILDLDIKYQMAQLRQVCGGNQSLRDGLSRRGWR